MNITLTSGILDYDAAWEWLNEFPAANFDDEGPTHKRAFVDTIMEREKRGETLYTVSVDHSPVGIIGYAPITTKTGMLHGICFSREVHGSGIPQRAVRLFLAAHFAEGVEKISATYFSDNTTIRRFLKELGAVDEGLLKRQTYRGGVAIDMRVVAFFEDALLRE